MYLDHHILEPGPAPIYTSTAKEYYNTGQNKQHKNYGGEIALIG